MAFTEDVSEFFDTQDGFAEVIQVNAVQVDAIVDLPSKDTDLVEDTQPLAVCALADVSTAVQGDPVIMRGKNYKITNTDPDETEKVISLYLEDA